MHGKSDVANAELDFDSASADGSFSGMATGWLADILCSISVCSLSETVHLLPVFLVLLVLFW